LLPIAPDLDEAAIRSIAELVEAHRIDAVIATNTTVSRSGVEGMSHADEAGGLSGDPLREKSDQVLATLKANLNPKVALIGVGGISSGVDAVRKIELGADLVQFYTGFVYKGPDLVADCLRALESS
jgi:dihydroorotate dehydrogenase